MGSTAAVVLHNDPIEQLGSIISMGAYTLLENRIKRKFEWIEGKAYDVQSKIKEIGLKDPFSYSLEHY